MALYGRTRKAILETIRICKDKNVLKEYLESREREVVDIMMALYDEEEIMRSYIKSEVQEAVQDMGLDIARDMIKDNEPIDKIIKYSKLSKETILDLQKQINL